MFVYIVVFVEFAREFTVPGSTLVHVWGASNPNSMVFMLDALCSSRPYVQLMALVYWVFLWMQADSDGISLSVRL